jgi:hypothetical protein
MPPIKEYEELLARKEELLAKKADDDEIIIKPAGETAEEEIIILGKKINAVLFEMITGTIIFGLVSQMTIVWFVKDTWGFSLGLWLGIAAAIGYIVHMWWSLGQYLYMGTRAVGIARKHTGLRYLMVLALLILVAITNAVQLLAVVLGIMGVKAGAFLQPFVQKLCRKVV